MLIVPKEKPLIENLNSYYLDIRKLLEHYQGDFGTGGIHFQSPSAEAIIFFDKDEILNGVFLGGRQRIEGRAAMEHLMAEAARDNFQINIYRIHPEKVAFWANTPFSRPLYKDLSTEFTDLTGLVHKMSSDGFTGLINITIGDGEEGGILFFVNGKLNGGSYSWEQGLVKGSEENNDLLIQKTMESGGTFDVIDMVSSSGGPASQPEKRPSRRSSEIVSSLGELLALLERAITSNKKIKVSFGKVLKKKFLEKAERYPFLDPFAAELVYSEQQIVYTGDASDRDLARGVIEAVEELAQELGIFPELKGKLKSLSQAYF